MKENLSMRVALSLLLSLSPLSALAAATVSPLPNLAASVILTNSMRAFTGMPRLDESHLRLLDDKFGPIWGMRVAMTNDAVMLLARIETSKKNASLRARLIAVAGGGPSGERELARHESLARELVAAWRAHVGAQDRPGDPAIASLDSFMARLESAGDAAAAGAVLGAYADGRALHATLYQKDDDVRDDSSARGQTLLLVGAKPAILKEASRVADTLKFRLVLADSPQARSDSAGLIPDDDFVPVPGIDRHDRNALHAASEVVARFAEKTPIDRVITFTNKHLLAAGRIADRLDADGISRQVFERAFNKLRARRLWNKVPELAVRTTRVESAAEAGRAFQALGGGKKRRFVIKANAGDNGQFVELGITSPARAERAYRKLRKALKAAAMGDDAGIYDVDPWIMMEEMFEKKPGTHEISTEMVMQNGDASFAMVSDTRSIGPRGTFPGGSMTFPSQQSREAQEAIVAAAVQAAKSLGIRDGNVRVDLIDTPDGTRVIEVNLRMGGASIWKVVQLLTGVNLIEQGFRARLGLRVDPGNQPAETLVYSFMAGRFTGKVASIKGLEEALQMPGVRHLKMIVSAGDGVVAAKGGASQELGEIIVTGATYEEASARALAAMRTIRIGIRRKGRLVWQTGDFLQIP